MRLLALFNGHKDPRKTDREDPNSIGSILKEWGYVTEDELEKAVKVQKSERTFSQILIEVTDGRLTDEQVGEAFMEQKIRKGKATRREISVFNSKKKRRLVQQIQEGFDNITTVADAIGTEEVL